jgi:hypothetical protein
MESLLEKRERALKATSAEGTGRLLYKDLSRRITTTNKDVVGFEIEGKIPAWESARKLRYDLRYDIRSIINFQRYTEKKDKREEGIIKYKHKYTAKQQLIFWRVLLSLAAAKLVENKIILTLPKIGKLILAKTNRIGSYYCWKDRRYKRYLNLHTFRKFISINFKKSGAMEAPTVKYEKTYFIKKGMKHFYLLKQSCYDYQLNKIKKRYGLHQD